MQVRLTAGWLAGERLEAARLVVPCELASPPRRTKRGSCVLVALAREIHRQESFVHRTLVLRKH